MASAVKGGVTVFDHHNTWRSLFFCTKFGNHFFAVIGRFRGLKGAAKVCNDDMLR